MYMMWILLFYFHSLNYSKKVLAEFLPPWSSLFDLKKEWNQISSYKSRPRFCCFKCSYITWSTFQDHYPLNPSLLDKTAFMQAFFWILWVFLEPVLLYFKFSLFFLFILDLLYIDSCSYWGYFSRASLGLSNFVGSLGS